MAGKFEIFKDAAGEHRFRLRAGNGEKILASEGYKSKSSARDGVASVRKNASDVKRFEKKTASNGKHFFVLKAGNNQIVGNSEMYESEGARDQGIASVMATAPGAEIVDMAG